MELGKNYLSHKLSSSKKLITKQNQLTCAFDETLTVTMSIPAWMYVNKTFDRYNYVLSFEWGGESEMTLKWDDQLTALTQGSVRNRVAINFNDRPLIKDYHGALQLICHGKNVWFTQPTLTVVGDETWKQENMKPMIMVIGGGNYMNHDLSYLDPMNIYAFAHVYNYHFRYYLQKLGYETFLLKLNKGVLSEAVCDLLPNVTHVIDTNLRGISNKHKVDSGFIERLRKKTSGYICQICDKGVEHKGPQDVTFYGVPVGRKTKPRNHWIGWAANSDYMKPSPDSLFRIIINQRSTKENGSNPTNIIESVLNQYGNKPGYEVVRYAWNDQCSKYTDHFEGQYDNYVLIKEKIPLMEKIKLQNTARVFVQCRKESLGISVIEAAMSGALVVLVGDMIKPALVDNMLPCLHFKSLLDVDWSVIEAKADPAKIHQEAFLWNWDNLALRINLFLTIGVPVSFESNTGL